MIKSFNFGKCFIGLHWVEPLAQEGSRCHLKLNLSNSRSWTAWLVTLDDVYNTEILANIIIASYIYIEG